MRARGYLHKIWNPSILLFKTAPVALSSPSFSSQLSLPLAHGSWLAYFWTWEGRGEKYPESFQVIDDCSHAGPTLWLDGRTKVGDVGVCVFVCVYFFPTPELLTHSNPSLLKKDVNIPGFVGGRRGLQPVEFKPSVLPAPPADRFMERSFFLSLCERACTPVFLCRG